MITARKKGVAAGVARPSSVRRSSRYRVQALALKTGTYIILIVLALLTIFPLVWMVLMSLTPEDETFGSIIPTTIDTSAYSRAWTSMGFPQAFESSVFVTVLTVVIVVAVATLTGYAFARLTFPGREVIFY